MLAKGACSSFILAQDGDDLAQRIRAAGYGVTVVNGMGSGGEVKLLYTAVPLKNLDLVIEIIKSVSPKAFFSAVELRSAESGIFPNPSRHIREI
jgi:uncharacterized protein YebE (UPF0316 family)